MLSQLYSKNESVFKFEISIKAFTHQWYSQQFWLKAWHYFGGKCTGKLPSCPPCLSRCPCTTAMRLWLWKASQWMRWMTAHLHQRWSEKPMPHTTTTSTRKKNYFKVVGNCLLMGTEGPVCWTDPPLREACCLPGSPVKNITRKLPSLVWPSDYYPLLLFHVGSNEAVTCSPKRLQGLGTIGKGIWNTGYFLLSSSIRGHQHWKKRMDPDAIQ